MCLRHYCYPARSSRAQPSVRSGLRIDDSILLTSKTAWRVLVVYIHTRRAEPLLNKTASLRKSKMPATCLDRSGRTDGLGRAEPFCLDRLRALRSERGSGSDLWTLWHMSSGVFRDEHHQLMTSGCTRTPTPFPCKSIGAEFVLHEPTVLLPIREIGYTATVLCLVPSLEPGSSSSPPAALQTTKAASVGASCRHRTGGKGKKEAGLSAQLRHSDAITYLPRVSKKHPLRNRVILLLRILPICSCWPGVREVSLPRHWSAASHRIADARSIRLPPSHRLLVGCHVV
jgi:hypothetical protein